MPMTPETRAAWTKAWSQARAEKDERRKQNREAWARRRDWSDDNKVTVDAVVEDDAAAGTDAAPATSSSLTKLRAIMRSTATPLYRRIDAAETIIAYELSPGSLVGVDNPDLIAASSYKFLKKIADAADTPEPQRFRCLKAIIAVEASRKQAVQSDGIKLEFVYLPPKVLKPSTTDRLR